MVLGRDTFAGDVLARALERSRLTTDVEEVVRAKRVRVALQNRDQPLGIVIRKRAEQYRVHHGKNRGVRADSESEREDGNSGKALVLEKHPQAVTKILEKCVHGGGYPWPSAIMGSARVARSAGM